MKEQVWTRYDCVVLLNLDSHVGPVVMVSKGRAVHHQLCLIFSPFNIDKVETSDVFHYTRQGNVLTHFSFQYFIMDHVKMPKSCQVHKIARKVRRQNLLFEVYSTDSCPRGYRQNQSILPWQLVKAEAKIYLEPKVSIPSLQVHYKRQRTQMCFELPWIREARSRSEKAVPSTFPIMFWAISDDSQSTREISTKAEGVYCQLRLKSEPETARWQTGWPFFTGSHNETPRVTCVELWGERIVWRRAVDAHLCHTFVTSSGCQHLGNILKSGALKWFKNEAEGHRSPTTTEQLINIVDLITSIQTSLGFTAVPHVEKFLFSFVWSTFD